MADFNLDRLLARARSRRMSPREHREQGISFIVGNEAVEGPWLHRGTVTMAVPRTQQTIRATAGGTVAWPIPTVPFDLYGPLRQFRLIQALVERHVGGELVTISPELILKLHAAAGDESSSIFGTYRNVAVKVLGSKHRPLAPASIPEAVTALCDHLQARWAEESAIALSAYALWRLNWIHPFLDGNGRTARALCYLVLNLKLGMQIPGSPTLIEQLRERRDEYFDALAAADISYDTRGEADLTSLQQLLERLLLRQLQSLPALSGRDEAQLDEIVARRIERLDSHFRERLFGSVEIAYRAWSSADHLLLHVGPREALSEAEERFSKTERPFPGLLAVPGQAALLTLTARQRGAVIRPRTFKVGAGAAAIWLEPNAAVALERPAVSIDDGLQRTDWALDGVLYILRRGDELSDLWAFDFLDLLVRRHIHEAS